ncbi:MAG: hypothetical protein PWQ70_3082 [Clostridiales bacterium]|nr:hypothetical protein [Clostridiales bacterium]
MEFFDINLVLASFGGGLFGASLGVIGAFSFCGVVILTGIAAVASGGSDVILKLIAFGPYFGPHISFASAVAATAYAGKKELLDGSKDILVPLYKTKRFDVLLVGGIFGVLNYIVNTLLMQTNIPIDKVAFTIVITNIIARLVFGRAGLFGKLPKENSIWPDSSTFGFNVLLGFAVGLISSFATQITGSEVIGFGISAFTLIFLFYDEFPVTHHVSICAAYAAAATGSILVGGIFGILAILCGEMFGNLFNSNADTYIDPPALTIALLSAIVFIFLK